MQAIIDLNNLQFVSFGLKISSNTLHIDIKPSKDASDITFEKRVRKTRFPSDFSQWFCEF